MIQYDTIAKKELKLQKAWMLACLIEKYRETEMAGGCLHVIIDDGNYGYKNANLCLNYSIERRDYWGEHIARILLEFNEYEQEQIIERSWEIEEQILNPNKYEYNE